MRIGHYPAEIQELLSRQTVLDQSDHYADEELLRLRTYGDAREDGAIIGFAEFQMAKKDYLSGNIPSYREHLLKAVRALREVNEPEHLAACFNMIGVDNVSRGNYDLSISHFLAAADLMKRYPDNPLTGIIECNVGNLYGVLGDPRTALSYTMEGMRFLEPIKFQGTVYLAYLVSVVMTGWFALDCGEEEAVRTAYDKLWQLKMDPNIPHEALDRIGVHAFEAYYAYHHGEKEEVASQMDAILELMDDKEIVAVSTDDLYRFGRFLIREEFLPLAKRTLQALEIAMERRGTLNLQLLVTRLSIEYATAANDLPLQSEKLQYYYALSERMDEEKSDTYTFSIALSSMLQGVRNDRLLSLEEDVRARKQLMTDAMTHLPSKRAFNTNAFAAYRKAGQTDAFFGVAIAEIDDFDALVKRLSKETAEQALKAVAAQIRRICAAGSVSGYRYGAGRFFMLFEAMDNRAIYAKATSLQEGVAHMEPVQAEDGTPVHMTLSQGICNSVPTDGFKLWDFLAEADAALRSSRDGKRTGDIAFYSPKR